MSRLHRAAMLGAALAIALSALAAQANPFAGGWRLSPEASSLTFQSIKNNTKIEQSGFATLSGGIDERGEAVVEVALDSVDTKIDLRNVRMRFLFFETFKFPTATIRMTVDPAALEGLPQRRRMTVTADYTLDLHGVTKPMQSDIVVTYLDAETVSVASAGPISVAAEDFDLTEGVLKLQDAAKVTIVPAGSVSFDFMFTRSAPAPAAPGVASAQPAGQPLVQRAAQPAAQNPAQPVVQQVATPARAALETSGVFSREECEGRFEILSRTGSITFASGSARLSGESAPFLAAILDIVQRCPDLAIEVGGHTDSVGAPDLNQRLSEARAAAVAAYLAQNGVAATRVSARGYGEARPAYPNDTPRNRALNRRIEFVVQGEG